MSKIEIFIVSILSVIAFVFLLYALNNPTPPPNPKRAFYTEVVDKMECVMGKKNKGCFCILEDENKIVVITSAPLSLCGESNED